MKMPQFTHRTWLIRGIIGGGIALVVLIFVAYLSKKPRRTTESSPHAESNNQPEDQPDRVAKSEPARNSRRWVRPSGEPPTPAFILSGNSVGRLRLFQGWPLLVQGRLLDPRAFTRDEKIEPMVLAAADGPWTGAVHLEVRDAAEKKVDWPFHLATAAKSSVALDNQTAGYIGWWLSPEETAKLPPGEHVLEGVLDTRTTRAAGAWKGIVRTRSVRIRIVVEPKMLDTEQVEEKHLLLASVAQLRGEQNQALAYLDSLLANQPKNVSGLEHKGDLLAGAGQTEEALRSYDAAIAAYSGGRRIPNQPSLEPPAELLRKHRDVLVEFLKK
jgi:hypothetical protein